MARVSIEDCLNVMENRFALVTVAADRTRQLMEGDEALRKTKNKEAVTALREIADGLVTAQMPEESEIYTELAEKEKAEAEETKSEVVEITPPPVAEPTPEAEQVESVEAKVEESSPVEAEEGESSPPSETEETPVGDPKVEL